jgi:hypothetical protein
MSNCKECQACPFNIYSEEAMYANDMGCLPDYTLTLKYYEEEGLVWACHDKPDTACNGMINYFNKNKTKDEYLKLLNDIKQNNIKYDWSVHGKEYDIKGFILSYMKENSIVEYRHLGKIEILKIINFDIEGNKFEGIIVESNCKITTGIENITNLFLRGTPEFDKYHSIKQKIS